MAFWKRTHICNDLRIDHKGQEVSLLGWVQRTRDHGGLTFIDLRDRSGLVQIVFDPVDEDIHKQAQKFRTEFVIAVKGVVTSRPEGTVNPNLATGEVEVRATGVQLLNKSETPPFLVEDGIDTSEELRMKYRYLDLRRPEMFRNLHTRHKVIKVLRDYFDEQGFVEIETPILYKSTPETGAREYVVPSRLNQGMFYALPQSPQQLKQTLMVAGVERYFQIARCFRDEDLRADRQPEFTQLDFELSFIDQEDIFNLVEPAICRVMKNIIGMDIKAPFPRMPYSEAMLKIWV